MNYNEKIKMMKQILYQYQLAQKAVFVHEASNEEIEGLKEVIEDLKILEELAKIGT